MKEQKELIEPIHFSDLNSLDPEAVVSRTGCGFDPTARQYILTVWGHKYIVDLKTSEVRCESQGMEMPHEYLPLFILYYLMKSKNIPPSGTWVSEKDIPGGAAFFRGPHTLPTALITRRFREDVDAFKKACATLGGTPMDMADAAFFFQITPTLPVAVLYWQGDQDFESEAKLLFDKTIARHLPLDIVYALAVGICHVLGK